MKIFLIVLGVSVLTWTAAMVLLRALAKEPTCLGVRRGRLAGCPSSPNCVCSDADDEEHAVASLRFTDPPDEAWRRLEGILANRPRSRVIVNEDGYLHAECTSFLFRFVDDLEFLLDREGKTIRVRSASRAGRGDLGVNRARVEAIRAAFGG